MAIPAEGTTVNFQVTLDELSTSVQNAVLPKRIASLPLLANCLKTDLVNGIHAEDEFNTHRKSLFGSNYIPPQASVSFLQLCFEALKDKILILLIVCAVASIAMELGIERDFKHGWIDGTAILVSVIVVVSVTAINDWQKERQFRELNAVKDNIQINVIRGGSRSTISIYDIVVGDLVELAVGDIVCADGWFVKGNDLQINESALTGESDNLKKNSEKPIIFSGTQVMEGSGLMLVLAVGPNSQQGIIKSLIATGESSTTAVGEETYKHPSCSETDLGVPVTDMACSDDEDSIDDHNSDDIEKSSVLKKKEKKKKKKKKKKAVLQGKLEKLALQIGRVGTFAAISVFLALFIRMFVRQFALENSTCVPNMKVASCPCYKGICGLHKGLWSLLLQYFTLGITILVVAIPEGLPLAVTLSLAYSVKRMMQDSNLVRHLDACETMGSATTVCSDKTGTLTTNRMTVMAMWLLGKSHRSTLPMIEDIPEFLTSVLCESIALNSSARLDFSTESGLTGHIGSKTECALLQFATDLGIDYEHTREKQPSDRVYTFSSARKRMSTLIPTSDGSSGKRLLTKGASEIVLDLCTNVINRDGEIVPLNEELRRSLDAVINEYADDGLRTLTIAYRDFDPQTVNSMTPEKWDDVDAIESGLTLVGIFGIEDPVRPEVPEAIRQCRRAGITVRMVTGDNIATARSIAKKCGLLDEPDATTWEGKDFRMRVAGDEPGSIDQEQFDQIWPNLRVLARSSPSDKFNLVTGLLTSNMNPKHPQVVAVTGDGTNDAPALKQADVGFAMGLSGTSVAKEASDIILMDDNFSSIVKAIKWGRNVHDSVAKFLCFQLTVNAVALTLVFISAITTAGGSPLTTVQMLWVNLIMDSMGSLALSTEPPTDALLDRRPYSRNRSLLSKIMIRNILVQAVYQLLVLFLILYDPTLWGVTDNGEDAEYSKAPSKHYTFLFNTFVFLQVFNELNARHIHNEKPTQMFRGFYKNPIFVAVIVVTVGLQTVLIEAGGLAIFTKPLPWNLWLISVGLGAGALPVAMLTHFIPASIIPFGVNDDEEGGLISEPIQREEITARDRWIRGTRRISQQLRVVRVWQMTTNELIERRRRSSHVINLPATALNGGGVSDDFRNSILFEDYSEV